MERTQLANLPACALQSALAASEGIPEEVVMEDVMYMSVDGHDVLVFTPIKDRNARNKGLFVVCCRVYVTNVRWQLTFRSFMRPYHLGHWSRLSGAAVFFWGGRG